MRSVLLSAIITRCRQRTDLEGDTHVSDAELQVAISAQVGEMHMLVDAAGMRYHETTATITATGASSYTLPTDHLATIRISQVDANGRNPRRLNEVQIHDEEHPQLGQAGQAQDYAIIGQTIEFYPNPTTGSFKHRYIPQPVDIGAVVTSTSIDLISPDGEEFVIEGVACKVLRKSETSTDGYILARNEARERLKEWAMARSFVTPRHQVMARYGEDYDSDPSSYRNNRP
jgi:hypothetical protein